MRLLRFDGLEARGAGWGWNTEPRDGWDVLAKLIGDDGVEEQNPGAGGDTIGNTIATTGAITVNGATQNGFVNTVGDDDWYAVTLVAGQSYTFTLIGTFTDPGGAPSDAYLELFNSAGTLIGIDDDFGPALNAQLRWTATTSGAYYVNARAFEGAGVSYTGSYTLTAATSAPASPLDSINYHFTMPGPNIAIWFAPAGFINPSGDTASESWTGSWDPNTQTGSGEIGAVFASLLTFSAITPLTFTQAGSQGAANWILSLVELEGNTLGYFSPQVNGYGAFDPTVAGWTEGLTPGGNSWGTLIHEFGHGLGLAHPHDNGAFNYGTNNSEILQGVLGPFSSSGTFGMNTGLSTMMTYNDSGQSTPMGLDVALLQQRYGVNPNTGSGDTGYAMSLGASSYVCIWDVSGTDTISYSGSATATIDLRAATLLNAVGGGGFVSSVQGVLGGFTIANGVLIENATGGSGNDFLIGNAANNILNGGFGDDSMSGGGGDDTYFVSGLGDLITEAADSGADHVFSTLTHQLSSNVENLTLTNVAGNGTGNSLNNIITGNASANTLSGQSGDDQLLGNDGVDTLNGGDGNDTLNGGIGNDTLNGDADNDSLDGGAGSDAMLGGAGDDVYFVDDAGDTATESASAGTDIVHAAVSFVLAANVENLTLTGAASINGTGNALNNTLTGNSGANTLDGGAGADAMAGGGGNDIYVVDDAADTVTEGASAGTDLVQASATFGLTANIENLTLTGGAAISGFGNILANIITGNGAANQLNGFDGADTLDGGLGGDNMFGGNGDDAYIVDNTSDQTTEASALGGTDTVFASVNRNLTANIENLTLTGAADITGAGNVLNNFITGNSGANTLYGFDGADRLDGGTGADSLFGANGDDVYVVDDVNDITVEGSPAGGTDTVESSISRNLNANFENLILTGAAQFGYGNVLNNTMTGNAAANGLYGFDGNDTLDGGAGVDQMFGANGDDTYIVDNASDVTSEVSALGGTDTVQSSVARNLTANLENLILTGGADINGAGNVLANVITGNSGVNTLFGLDGADTLDGGLGADTLQGGLHADSYVFSSALGGGNVDAIVNYSVADDTIVLNNAVFTGLGAGTLDAGAFVIGSAAADADDRIIYNSATGQLLFDGDGDGAGAAILFATLTAGLALTNNDFIVSGP